MMKYGPNTCNVSGCGINEVWRTRGVSHMGRDNTRGDTHNVFSTAIDQLIQRLRKGGLGGDSDVVAERLRNIDFREEQNHTKIKIHENIFI